MSSDKKLDACRLAVKRAPNDGGLQLKLAQAALKANQIDEALAAAQEATRSAVHRPRAGLVAARAMLVRQAFVDAENLAGQLIAEKVGAEAYNIRGEARGNLQKFEQAREDFVTALRLEPKNFSYLFNLAICMQMMGALDEAISIYERALKVRPGNTDVIIRLAGSLIANTDYPKAIQTLEALLGTQPEHALAWNSLGVALQHSGQHEQAKFCYEKAAKFEPKLVEAFSNLGTLSQATRDLERAEKNFRRALELNPEHPDALAGLASIMVWQGRYGEGLKLVSHWIESGSQHPELLVSWAALMRHSERQEEAIKKLKSTTVTDVPSLAYQQRLSFLLGDMYNDLGQYESAFEAYRLGNELKKAKFDRAAHDRFVDLSIQYFTREWIEENRFEQGGEGMVFIVGMPRSGTSLSEQILAAHPQVHAFGELTYLFEMVTEIQQLAPAGTDYPYVLDKIGKERLATFAAEFISLVTRGAAAGATRFTDKMPGNFLYLAVINMMFPNARVIHISRDSLDVCLSSYFQNFSAPGMNYAFDLGDIASYYRGYRRLIKHLRGVIDIQFMEMTYEDLVADTEAQMRRMIDFVGLEWDPVCLEFHRLDRTIITASHAQVRKPIYKTSAGRHEHYRPWIGPLIEGLGNLIDEPRP